MRKTKSNPCVSCRTEFWDAVDFLIPITLFSKGQPKLLKLSTGPVVVHQFNEGFAVKRDNFQLASL